MKFKNNTPLAKYVLKPIQVVVFEFTVGEIVVKSQYE